MTTTTTVASASRAGGSGPKQWVLERVQMVNWGCYQGHVTVVVPADQTIITGASGSGKSTLLDAHTALLYRSSARFNTASNRAERGRARGEGERNVAKYMRGRVAGTRDLDGHATDRILREGTVWSALAETYACGDGRRFTAWVAYYMRPDESKPSVQRWAYRPDSFDLSGLAPFAGEAHSAKPLPKQQIKEAYPGTKFCDGPVDFRGDVYDELGLTQQATRLLEDIQSSAGVGSVTELFRTLVLERPGTYDAADTARDHFASCAAAYQNLRDHEDQVALLRPIRDWRDKMLKAQSDADFLHPLGASAYPSDSPFWQWVRDTQDRLLAASADRNRNRRATAGDAAAGAKTQVRAAKEALDAALRRVAAAGGDRLMLLEQQITEAQNALTKAELTRQRYAELTAEFVLAPTSREEHDAQLAESRLWLAGRGERDRTLEARRETLAYERGVAETEIRDLMNEARFRASRKDLISQDADADRRSFAAATGLDPERLPFLAELVDMAPEWEQWRLAVEKALGGLAMQILVPARAVAVYRRQVDAIRTRWRYQWITVPDEPGRPDQLDPDTAAGRLQFKTGHPYSGWLSRYLADRLGHVCVTDGSGLNELPPGVRGLTLQGQVRDGSRGAHGGQEHHRYVIGFSAQGRLTEITTRVDVLRGRIVEFDRQRDAARHQQEARNRQHDARQHIVGSAWDDIDVAGRINKLDGLLEQRQRLRDGNSGLVEAEEARDLADLDYQERVGAEITTRAEVDAAATEHEYLCTQQDIVSKHQDQMLEGDIPFPDVERLSTRFTEWHGGPPDLDALMSSHHLMKFTNVLANEGRQASRTVDERRLQLAERFTEYNRRWGDSNRGNDPDASFDEFDALLSDRLAAALDTLRDKFVEWTSTVTGLELVKVKQQFDAAPKAITDRLAAVNAVLARLDYSSRGGRISIVPHPRRTGEVQEFIAALVSLAEEATIDADFDTAVVRFERLKTLMDQIDSEKPTDKASRDRILDVRRHVRVEAEHHLPDGSMFAAYDTLGDQSGGEMQELAMFILGAALRYQLGDLDSANPRFAPVFMDEGMVKADPEHTDRALRVWSALGFQPIVALPVDKFESAQQGRPAPTLQISRDARGISRIDLMTPRP